MLGRLHEYFNEPINAPGAPSFYYHYLNWAVEYGIVHGDGDGDGDLMPHVLITREQMAVVVYRYVEAFGLERHLPPQPDDDAVPGDYQDISSWARHEVLEMMYRYRLMQGTDDWVLFNPQANSSRAEALTVLVRLGDVLYNAARFVLTISVEEASLPLWEPFWVHVELENNSGEDLKIAYGRLFHPHILGEYPSISGPHGPPRVRHFENGSTISVIIDLGGYYDLTPGVYQVIFAILFYIGWEPLADSEDRLTWSFLQNNAQRVEVFSNTIEITVSEPD